mmetsp:Transcript_2500/g.3824  ORF Transcript_2500/g.3824 Transcript_2500/m.3824 type:complete len:390 (-) Transcript_2500:229-1398(-)
MPTNTNANHSMTYPGFDQDAESDGSSECYASEPATTMTCSSSVESSTTSTTATSSMDSITGRYGNIRQKYHIDSVVIGTGYQAYAVRECINRATGQRYAVKSIRKSSPSVEMADLHREVKLLKEMQHNNIVRLVDVYEDAEHLHIVTDLYSGGELYDKIVQKRKSSSAGSGCIAEDEAAKILHQVLAALSHLHDRDIVHRDLKPENIMFESTDKNSPIKLIDFGLARTHRSCEEEEPYMSRIAGSFYFLAPEVLQKKYDKSCDLWSLGVIAYIMLCGYPPFNGESNQEVCDAVRRGKLRFQAKYWKGVSREAKDFIRRLLCVNPRKRMTVEDALNHPWMVKHSVLATKGEEHKCNSYAKMKCKRLRNQVSSLSVGGMKRGKLKLSLFRF